MKSKIQSAREDLIRHERYRLMLNNRREDFFEAVKSGEIDFKMFDSAVSFLILEAYEDGTVAKHLSR